MSKSFPRKPTLKKQINSIEEDSEILSYEDSQQMSDGDASDSGDGEGDQGNGEIKHSNE